MERRFSQYYISPHDALKHHFTSLKTDLIFLQQRVLEWIFLWGLPIYGNFFTFSPTSNHLQPLQVENCDSNLRLVVDEDDNGSDSLVNKFGLNTGIFLKTWWLRHCTGPVYCRLQFLYQENAQYLLLGLSFLVVHVTTQSHLSTAKINSHSTSTRHQPNAGLMLAQILRSWPNINPTWVKGFLGMDCYRYLGYQEFKQDSQYAKLVAISSSVLVHHLPLLCIS